MTFKDVVLGAGNINPEFIKILEEHYHHPQNFTNELCRIMLYANNGTDRSMSEQLGDNYKTIAAWRYRRGLPCINRSPRKSVVLLDAQEDKKRLTLYQQGYLDGEIAQKRHCSVNNICAWRHRRGLSTNQKDPEFYRRKYRKMMKLYVNGHVDHEIAEMCKLSTSSVWRFRKMAQLAPNGHKKTKKDKYYEQIMIENLLRIKE
jgi:hypothetical protein